MSPDVPATLDEPMGRASLNRLLADVTAAAHHDLANDDEARAVLLALVATSQRSGRQDVLPALTRLGRQLDASPAVARRAVGRLRRGGWLVAGHRMHRGGPRRYLLAVPVPAEEPST